MDLTSHVNAGFRCDKPGCTAEVSGDARADGTTYYGRIATRQGWTFWHARGRRAYCPSHGPNPGHRMRPIDMSR